MEDLIKIKAKEKQGHMIEDLVRTLKLVVDRKNYDKVCRNHDTICRQVVINETKMVYITENT